MLTLERLRALTESYGADLQRWPEETRAAAQALLSQSSEARALLEEARVLDDMIAAATAHEESARWRTGERHVAMARLRARVGARIATTEVIRTTPLRSWLMGLLFGSRQPDSAQSAVALRLRWIGLATTGALAVAAGLVIGAMYEATPATTGVLTQLLQPATFAILEN